MTLKERVEELERKVRELEARPAVVYPLYIPQPYYVQPLQPWYNPQPYYVPPYTITCQGGLQGNQLQQGMQGVGIGNVSYS